MVDTFLCSVAGTNAGSNDGNNAGSNVGDSDGHVDGSISRRGGAPNTYLARFATKHDVRIANKSR
jgi:hypothetical protein